MARLDDKTADKLRTLTVEALLEMRKAYLGSPGASALKNWDMLQSRMKIAARTAATPEQWATTMLRGLNVIAAPSVSNSACLVELCGEVHELDCFRQWKQMLNSEWGLLIAKCRLIAEQRAEAKKEAV